MIVTDTKIAVRKRLIGYWFIAIIWIPFMFLWGCMITAIQQHEPPPGSGVITLLWLIGVLTIVPYGLWYTYLLFFYLREYALQVDEKSLQIRGMHKSRSTDRPWRTVEIPLADIERIVVVGKPNSLIPVLIELRITLTRKMFELVPGKRNWYRWESGTCTVVYLLDSTELRDRKNQYEKLCTFIDRLKECCNCDSSKLVL